MKDFRVLGPQLSLFSELDGRLVFLPKGEVLYWSLMDQWRQMHVKMEFQFLHTFASLSPKAIHQLAYEKKEGEAPYRFASLGPHDKDLASIFCKKGEELTEIISSLQLLDQMIKIFGFKSEVSFTPPRDEKLKDLFVRSLEKASIRYKVEKEGADEGRVDFYLIDNAGVKSEGPFLALQEGFDRNLSLIYRSMFGSMERWIALMIESKR